jgi:2-oxoisovalerate dehydrogenase E1 component
MPKSILVDPRKVRKPGTLEIPVIPLNQYRSDPAAEEKTYGREALRNVYLDMLLIREFETMLDSIKVRGEYAGIEYNHMGPAHLSIGQESAAVGQCICLGPEDFIFGSHRSHGEILAKCFSALRQLPEAVLMDIMSGYLGGEILAVVEKKQTGTAQELAVDFVLYGVLAEIFGRRTGVNRGLGGSMHAFFAPFGSMPNNAIVGGSADIAVGAALFKRINRAPGIVIANIGDGSSGCGPVWEALMLAAMEQYRRLWPGEVGGAPPILFNFFNNFYGMGGQPEGETMGFKLLARLGAGVNEKAMHAERVDGTDPLAVADAVKRKREILAAGRGPVLLDTLTYRISGHSPSDASAYRSKEEIDLWREQDCIAGYGRYLTENGHAGEAELEVFKQQVKEKITCALELAVSPELSPRLSTVTDSIGELMFSNRTCEAMKPGRPETLLSLEENPRRLANRRKARFALDAEGRPLPKAKVISYRDALFEALLAAFYTDPTLAAWGEENRDWGGAFAVYRGLSEALPYHRLFNTPISEGAIVGSAVGYALCGGRVVAELMYCDFLGRAGDEVFNQMAKWQSMSAGVLTMPLVLRVSVGSKYGAQHSQDWTALTAHVPGLKVMFPATPYDAKGMLTAALRGTDPVVFFESQRLYDMGEIFVPGGVPEESYEVEEGEPALRRRGEDITIITVGAALYQALEAADTLAKLYGLSAEVIDLRYINPLNYDPLLESVRKTGKVLLVSDACERGSFLNTVAAQICQLAFDDLDGPPVVLGSRNTITPCAEMEESFFPQPEWILDALHERLLPLPGHPQPGSPVKSNQSRQEMLRRNRRGI